MSPRLIDISPLVSERIGVFPGDTPYRRQASLALAAGDNIDLSAMHATVHVGAHADAPSHYVRGGQGIEKRPLEVYYGPCQVVEVRVARGARIQPADLEMDVEAPRVLFKTGTFPNPELFNEDFASLSPALVDHLHARGVFLVGIDTPSIDPCHDKILESHQALARHDMAVLEGLVLEHVAPGFYTLLALPLRLEGADAAPVRAALISSTPDFPA
jgi:arylformamidase